MSSQISDLITYISGVGVQDTSRFMVYINDFDISPSVLSVKLPSPRIEFLKVSYWSPNPEYYMPYGLKYSETLLIEMLMPESSTWSTGSSQQVPRNFMNYLPTYMRERYYTGNKGTFFGGYDLSEGSIAEMTPFIWLRAGTNTVKIEAYDRKNQLNKTYEYKNCFFEKILPIEFDASKADVQTFTASFVVSGM